MSNKFEQQVIIELNKFRNNPKSLQHQCEVIHKGFSRLKSNDPFLDEIASFTKVLQNLKGMPSLEYNEVLSKSARSQLSLFVGSSNYQMIKDTNDIKDIVPDYYLIAEPCLIADEGADEAINVVTKILLNKLDKFKQGRNVLCDPKYTQIGIAQTVSEGENFTILIFATKYVTDEPEYEIPKGDLSELKKAFDILDVDGKLRLNMKETMSIIKSMDFEKTDPTLYKIFLELSDRDYCSWPKFAYFAHKRMTDRATKQGLETIFNLFIDDPEKQTITFETFKKICEEIGAGIPEDQLKNILKESTINGNEITYKEFENYMFEPGETQNTLPNITTNTPATNYSNNSNNVKTTYTSKTANTNNITTTTTTYTTYTTTYSTSTGGKKKNLSHRKK